MRAPADRGRVQEVPGLVVDREQPLDLRAQGEIARTHSVEKCSPLLDGVVEGLAEDLLQGSTCARGFTLPRMAAFHPASHATEPGGSQGDPVTSRVRASLRGFLVRMRWRRPRLWQNRGVTGRQRAR